MSKKINMFSEFCDKRLEALFLEEAAGNSLKYIRPVLLLSSAIYLILFVFDFLLLDAGGTENMIKYSLFPRLFIFVLCLFVFLFSKTSKHYGLVLKVVSALAILMYVLHIYMALHFMALDLTCEALNIFMLVLALFFLPSRWIVNFIISVAVCVLFLLFSPLLLKGISPGTTAVLSVYFLWLIVVMSGLTLRTNSYKRELYAKGLELERMTLTDSLTNAGNRMASDEMIKRLCDEKRRFCVALFDIDDFKRINDTCGHSVGDEVLKKIVSLVRENIREHDMLARWGGEEFILLLRDTTLETSVEIAERLCRLISSTNFENVGFSVTASFGLTEYMPGDGLASILRRVDRRLYSAKKSGKNRVCVSGE